MKRAAPSIEPADRPYIQQPVSCRFCRSRKLKCDRGRPSCFNCHSRNRECIYEADRREPSTLAAQTLASLPQPGDNNPSTNGNNVDLARRVERLERAVFTTHTLNSSYGKATSRPKTPRSRLASHDEEQLKTSRWLEGLLTADTSGGSPALSPVRSEVSTILQEFPSYNDAMALLYHYIQTVDATYRMLHHPTAWHLLRVLYDDLEANRLPSATQVSFFLCIFAGSAYVSRKKLNFESPSLQGHSQVTLAELWVRRAVSLLTEPPAPPSVEALQTSVGLMHLCTQIEGLRGSFGALAMLSLQMARAMNIHRLDTQPNREHRRKNGADMVELETKRRIWWHMVASDWLLSFVGGPNEGTYMLHPRQMETFRPSNVQDLDIPQDVAHVTEESYSSPIDSPTSMSYFLHRIESATLVREVVDCLPPSYFASPGKESSDEIYDNILSLDRKYQQHIESLPPFFQLTIKETASYQALLRAQPYLEWQRYLINLLLHTQLARLHRPFLIRGSREAKYEHSRLQCIRSAETVIEIRNRAMSDQSPGSFTYVLQHFLTAAIILAMDVCFNPDRDQAPRRKQQVMRACRAMEEELNAKVVPSSGPGAEDISSGQLMLRSFQNAVRNLRDTLRKHMPREEEPDGASSSSVRDALPLTHNFSRFVIHRDPAEQVFGTADIYRPQPREDEDSRNMQSMASQVTHEQSEQMQNLPARNDDITRADEASEPFLVDELWDDFFTVGSTLNETDWDAFFSDVGANMG
ncbi:hypothetical protein HRR83_009184 [Exophiala dermatitidis]|uniref:Zn(2)-C6 fungal-type domain-containing protein n=2 Tax=Exophiala dermatitidis TaxID=5970 RepID=H6BUR0_EXODN|nr:uncharacterized protein HMPREF1120_03871 [Exophiala dermatitidis NIH/UT8656]KAJ4503001.1 hypothetical protein HRR73_009275 [Exophiala dermatitidis]EHY55747.1 hypothetical protein HMPREF1120_03871 [Exophiala dermatitidis NIH/UT8656]KAJ4503424.1 hypothetical protein HRR74_009331 [Exophiala dermatitidis]KAJ4535445.1 hypothetical protein HRR77_008060 [Exophiala dermatitidis]KAJ4540674.1 hypothetical protein HRR76_004062 [Exophiala dermatitidis]